MGLDKKALERIVLFVKAVQCEPGSEEFIAELRNSLQVGENSTPVMNGSIDPKIEHIYEYCIEDIARKQAKEFYADFPLPELIDGLVEDYVRMEYFKRKDNFGDFCLAAYQQIERVTNELFRQLQQCTYINEIIGLPPFMRNGQRVGSGKSQKISDIVWSPSEYKKDPSAMDKVKNIIYFVIDGASQYTWDYNFFSGLYDIYNVRNTNHRGPLNDAQLKLYTNSSLNYFIFHGLLARFIIGAKKGIQNNNIARLKELVPYPSGDTSRSSIY